MERNQPDLRPETSPLTWRLADPRTDAARVAATVRLRPDRRHGPRLALLDELLVDVERRLRRRRPRAHVDFARVGPGCVLRLQGSILARHVVRRIEVALRSGAGSVLVVARRTDRGAQLVIVDDGRATGGGARQAGPDVLAPARRKALRPTGTLASSRTVHGARLTRIDLLDHDLAPPEVALP